MLLPGPGRLGAAASEVQHWACNTEQNVIFGKKLLPKACTTLKFAMFSRSPQSPENHCTAAQ